MVLESAKACLPSTMSSYYVKTKRNGAAKGPFTKDQLKALAIKGKLKPHYLVSKDGDVWYVAKNITDLPMAPATAATRPGRAKKRARPPAPTAETPAREPQAVAPGTRRFPIILLAGLACALLAVVAVTVYALYFKAPPTDKEYDELAAILRGPAPPEPKAGKPPKADVHAAVPSPSPGAIPRSPNQAPPSPAPSPKPSPPAGRKPTPEPPLPRPRGKIEPLKPPESFKVLSAKYGGQVVRAMGSQLVFVLTNDSGRGIKSVKGSIRLYGPTGAYLAGLPVELADPIKAGEAVTKKGVWLNVGGVTLGLLDESPDQVQCKFAVDEVTYEDGKVESF